MKIRKYEIWNMKIWNIKYKIWNIRYKIWNMKIWINQNMNQLKYESIKTWIN
jgi:hypothetical protein